MSRRGNWWKWFRRIGLAGMLLFMVLYAIACNRIDSMMLDEAPIQGVRRETAETGLRWTISYLRAPDIPAPGPRLIYVHGTPGSAGAFKRYLQRPVAGLDSISPDRPGFGKTKPRRPALTLEDHAKVLEPLLPEPGAPPAILIGHSMGAPIICEMALQYPDRVGGLVLLSAALDPALEKVQWYQRAAGFAFMPYLIPKTFRNSNTELMPLKAELERLAPHLKEIRCPVIILHAPNDVLVPFENVAYMERAFAEGVIRETVILEGKNHFIPWNAEDAVREAIARVLEAG